MSLFRTPFARLERKTRNIKEGSQLKEKFFHRCRQGGSDGSASRPDAENGNHRIIAVGCGSLRVRRFFVATRA
jgi:hypothetical protein